MVKSINLITPFKTTSFKRQFVHNSSEIIITENGSLDKFYDSVFIYEDLPKEVTVKTISGNLIYISGEPPISRKYSPKFLSQFDYVISCHPNISHNNNILSQQSLPWHFGYDFENDHYNYNYDDLKSMNPKSKGRKISIIASGKTMMPGHRRRIEFINGLKKYFPSEIDFYGRDSNSIADKAEAILPYMMSICIENSSIDNYWTEKIADAYLGYSLPIYYGCKNIEKYFLKDSYIEIDITRTKDAFEKIEYLLNNCEVIYNSRLDSIIKSRNLILNTYNIYNLIINFYNDKKLYLNKDNVELSLMPTEKFSDYLYYRSLLKLERFIKNIL